MQIRSVAKEIQLVILANIAIAIALAIVVVHLPLQTSLMILALGGGFIIAMFVVSLLGWKRLKNITLYGYVFLAAAVQSDIGWISIAGRQIPAYVLVLPALIIFLVLQRLERSRGSSFIVRPLLKELVWAIVLLVIVLLSLIIVAPNPLKSTIEALQLGVFICGYFIVAFLVDDRRLWKQLVLIFILTFIGFSLIALYRYFVQPVHWHRLIISEGKRPNQLAFVMETPVLVLFSILFTLRARQASKLQWGLYLSGFVILLTSFMLIVSRGAWIAAFVGAAVFGLLSLPKIKFQRIIAIGFFGFLFSLVMIAIIGLSVITNRLAFVSESVHRRFAGSSENRLEVFQIYVDQILQTPFLGSGYGVVLQEADFGDVYGAKGAHNSYLAVWTDSGVFAFLSMMGFLIVHGANLWQVRHKMNEDILWGNIFIGIYIAALVHMLAANFFFSNFFWSTFAFQAAAIHAYSGQESDQ